MAARHRITRKLLDWYRRSHRDLPWRKTSDPYRIWVSEIMLQQTRAQAVIPYYERFLARFPSVESVAKAPENDVLALWSGLGYYSRARNLHRAARQVAAEGSFPSDYDAIRALPGIGDYTAAAVASIAFGLPHAVLDGNVLRVISRIENDSSDIASPRTRRRFRDVAQSWLDRRAPGAFNQALMELGATVCLPKNPFCPVCPVVSECGAHQAGTVSQLPVKLRKTKPVKIESVLLLIRRGGKILLRCNEVGDKHMRGFWDLPAASHLPQAHPGAVLGQFRHTITHHHYTFTVRLAELRGQGPGAGGRGNKFLWVSEVELCTLPCATTVRKALKLIAPAPGP